MKHCEISARRDPVVFGYNFPHKKTQDFLTRLMLAGRTPSLVLLADAVELKSSGSSASRLRVKPRHCDLLHPAEICESLGVTYRVLPHGGEQTLNLVMRMKPAVGVVAGARILPRDVIDCFSRGVVNFHPGLLPQVRGLGALQWAIYRGLPLGVTAHLIDHRVDAGRIVERTEIDVYSDDTLIDLSLRLYETQVKMLPAALDLVESRDPATFEKVCGGEHHGAFPAALESQLQERLFQRLALRRAG